MKNLNQSYARFPKFWLKRNPDNDAHPAAQGHDADRQAGLPAGDFLPQGRLSERNLFCGDKDVVRENVRKEMCKYIKRTQREKTLKKQIEIINISRLTEIHQKNTEGKETKKKKKEEEKNSKKKV